MRLCSLSPETELASAAVIKEVAPIDLSGVTVRAWKLQSGPRYYPIPIIFCFKFSIHQHGMRHPHTTPLRSTQAPSSLRTYFANLARDLWGETGALTKQDLAFKDTSSYNSKKSKMPSKMCLWVCASAPGVYTYGNGKLRKTCPVVLRFSSQSQPHFQSRLCKPGTSGQAHQALVFCVTGLAEMKPLSLHNIEPLSKTQPRFRTHSKLREAAWRLPGASNCSSVSTAAPP